MAIEKLAKGGWHVYFDALSKILQGKDAQIDVNARDIGEPVEAAFAPLLGIVYDPRNEILKVLVDGLDHTIAHVREIVVDHDGMSLNSIHVICADGTQQIIRVRDPQRLPAPPSHAMASHR